MNRYALKAHRPFKSQVEKKVIIGGDTDFCAERFGYIQGIDGITPAPTYRQTTTEIALDNIYLTDCLPTGVKAFFAATDGKVYSWNYSTTAQPAVEFTLSSNYASVFSTIVSGNNYTGLVSGNKIGLISSTKGMMTYNISVYLADAVMHCGRLFGIDMSDGYMIRWSGLYTIANWSGGVDGAGYVKLNPSLGKGLNLFVLNEKIVVVREYGITTITVFGDTRHMRMDLCEKHRLPAVYSNSSAICRGKLWIFTKNGIYVYDGNTTAKAPFDRIMSDYYLMQPKVVDDRYIYYTAVIRGSKCIFMYDTETGACNPFAKGCFSPFFTESKSYAFKGRLLVALDSGYDDSDRVWISEPIIYGGNKRAVLKSLTVEGSGNFTVETDCDGRKIYASGAGRHRCAESGQKFTFKVTGTGAITSMTAEWEVR